MWRLTIRQKRKKTLNDIENLKINIEVHFEDENQNNLLDLVRYLSECKVPTDTIFILSEVKDDVSRGN